MDPTVHVHSTKSINNAHIIKNYEMEMRIFESFLANSNQRSNHWIVIMTVWFTVKLRRLLQGEENNN